MSTLASEGNYGESGVEAFVQISRESGRCDGALFTGTTWLLTEAFTQTLMNIFLFLQLDISDNCGLFL